MRRSLSAFYWARSQQTPWGTVLSFAACPIASVGNGLIATSVEIRNHSLPRSITQLPLSITVFENLGSHPPWHCLSSHEVADLLGISVGTVWNWTLRGHGLIPEANGMHVRASTRRFFFPCLTLEWLAAREGEPVPAWAWCRTWLAAKRLIEPDATAGEVLAAVKAIDRASG